MIEFYDAAEWRNIPARANAAVYADGLFVAPAAQAYARFAKVRWITVRGGRLAAKYAGILDWEKFNAGFPDPAAMVDWADERRAMDKLARVYSDVSNLPGVHSAVGHLPNVRYWVALYGHGPLTADQLSEAVGGQVPPNLLWGHQYEGDATGGVDRDVLLSQW